MAASRAGGATRSLIAVYEVQPGDQLYSAQHESPWQRRGAEGRWAVSGCMECLSVGGLRRGRSGDWAGALARSGALGADGANIAAAGRCGVGAWRLVSSGPAAGSRDVLPVLQREDGCAAEDGRRRMARADGRCDEQGSEDVDTVCRKSDSEERSAWDGDVSDDEPAARSCLCN